MLCSFLGVSMVHDRSTTLSFRVQMHLSFEHGCRGDQYGRHSLGMMCTSVDRNILNSFESWLVE